MVGGKRKATVNRKRIILVTQHTPSRAWFVGTGVQTRTEFHKKPQIALGSVEYKLRKLGICRMLYLNMDTKKRVLTGITSSGKPHIGNILGAISPAIELSQDQTLEDVLPNRQD